MFVFSILAVSQSGSSEPQWGEGWHRHPSMSEVVPQNHEDEKNPSGFFAVEGLLFASLLFVEVYRKPLRFSSSGF
jgi:hypothetical protein